MATLSVCLIMKDEADVCARVLRSAQPFADELIVVDTGSSDATVEIARSCGAKVSVFEWNDNFSAARNDAFSKAGCDYLMWLDADDVVPESSAQQIRSAKASDFYGADVLMMPYHLAFHEDGSPSFSIQRERILRRCPLAEWQGAVHEVIRPFGQIKTLDAPIEHRKLHPSVPGRNLRIYESLIQKRAILSERERFYYARELADNGRFAEAEPVFWELLSVMRPDSADRGALCRGLAACRDAAGDPSGALRFLLFSLENGWPSAVTCSELGRRFAAKGRFDIAIEWYQRALADGGHTPETFDSPDCHGFLPCIQLCLCYDRLGQIEKAVFWNQRAALYRPDDPAVRYNAAYFAGLRART